MMHVAGIAEHERSHRHAKRKKWEGEKERRDIIPITRTSANRRREPI